MFTVSKTYEVITPRSAEHGDAAEHGFEYEDCEMTLREVLREVENTGRVEPSCWPCDKDQFARGRVWLSSVDREEDYQTGESTGYALRIKATPRNRARLFCFLAAKYPRQFKR